MTNVMWHNHYFQSTEKDHGLQLKFTYWETKFLERQICVITLKEQHSMWKMKQALCSRYSVVCHIPSSRWATSGSTSNLASFSSFSATREQHDPTNSSVTSTLQQNKLYRHHLPFWIYQVTTLYHWIYQVTCMYFMVICSYIKIMMKYRTLPMERKMSRGQPSCKEWGPNDSYNLYHDNSSQTA